MRLHKVFQNKIPYFFFFFQNFIRKFQNGQFKFVHFQIPQQSFKKKEKEHFGSQKILDDTETIKEKNRKLRFLILP